MSTDPTVSLEEKLVAFAATLTNDECTVLHEVVHLAAEGGEVHGFAVSPGPLGGSFTGDPCEGGEVTFPATFDMLGRVHVKLHDIRFPHPIDTSTPR